MTLEERMNISARLAELTEKNGGRLTPEDVVNDAKDRSSPLHAQIFRENDSDAAYQRRIDLARQLIRSVKINLTVHQQSISVVAYVHDPSDQHRPGYVPTVSLVNEKDRSHRRHPRKEPSDRAGTRSRWRA